MKDCSHIEAERYCVQCVSRLDTENAALKAELVKNATNLGIELRAERDRYKAAAEKLAKALRECADPKMSNTRHIIFKEALAAYARERGTEK